MGLPLSVEKIEEARDYLLYTFGPPGASVGRARLYKSSGDIELIEFDVSEDGPNERYVLAHVVPRLQDYHDRTTYPESDQWEA